MDIPVLGGGKGGRAEGGLRLDGSREKGQAILPRVQEEHTVCREPEQCGKINHGLCQEHLKEALLSMNRLHLESGRKVNFVIIKGLKFWNWTPLSSCWSKNSPLLEN